MPSPSYHLIYHKQITRKNLKTIKYRGKEQDLHLTLPLKRYSQYPNQERASISASASITIEASLAVPLFFLAAVVLIYLLEIMAIQTAVKSGLNYTGKKYAEQMYTNSLIIPAQLNYDMVQAIGLERLNRSIIVGGSSGLNMEQSYASAKTSIIWLIVTYQVQLPIPLFGVGSIEYSDQVMVKGWCGYVSSTGIREKEETVYVAETGLVYHQNYHCTYLDLSIRMVPLDQIPDLRNESQGKYYRCERCSNSELGSGVYITRTGNRYHNLVGCSGLKRSVYAIPKSEAVGKGACSRCGGQ